MTTNYNIMLSFWWMFILLATVEMVRDGFVEGIRALDMNHFEPKIKGTVKTIKVPEDGDLIDCVDIYQQPALKNRKDLKIEPSLSFRSVFNKTTNPLLNKAKNPPLSLIQNWHKYGECPKGTVPIRRNRKNSTRTTNPRPDNYEYAIGVQRGAVYHGVGASLNIWHPRTGRSIEHTTTQIWVVSSPSNVNAIEAGWMVNFQQFHDAQTRLFIYWTADGYQNGCYNDDCRSGWGFVHFDETVCLGCAITPVSIYGGISRDIYIALARDWITACWWLYVGNKKVGYFPETIFTTLGNGAETISIGGAIVNTNTGGRHTTTEMGSGHFADEGPRRASHVRNAYIIDHENEVVDASLTSHAPNPGCYNLLFGPPGTANGVHFHYGGPGWSFNRCP